MTKTGWLKCQWCGASPPPDDSPLLGKSRTNMGDLNLLTQPSLFKPACEGEPEEMLALVTSAFSTEFSIQSAEVKQEEKDDWSPFLSVFAPHEWGGLPLNKEKSEKKPTTRKRAPRSPKSVRLIVERHYIGNVPMNTLFQRLVEEEIRKTAESYLAAG